MRRLPDGWERRQASLLEATAPASQWLVDAIDLQPGQRVLELAAGWPASVWPRGWDGAV